ncbi:MAG: glycosyltransferase family 2 protein [Flavobacteriales bacterium]|nr:glycosyltransferase family 2 protein [Flavobacteriales bacterium]
MEIVISAVIVNYNAGRFLRACVDSLLACPLEINIIVVDNASTDKSLETLPSSPQITIIRNDQNLGFAAGCNIGIKAANADHVLFLNPDCTFSQKTITQLLDYLQTHDQVGMVGGLLVNPDGTEQAGGRRAIPTPWRTLVRTLGLTCFSDRWPRLFEDFHLHRQPLPAGPIEVEAISGACMLVKREALEDVGLWDEGYFLHCEDLDYCMRFRKNSWKIVFVPTAKIVHEHGACSKSRPIFVEWHKHKGMVRFYRKFFRRQYSALTWGAVIFGIWFRFSLVSTYHIAKLALAKIGARRD